MAITLRMGLGRPRVGGPVRPVPARAPASGQGRWCVVVPPIAFFHPGGGGRRPRPFDLGREHDRARPGVPAGVEGRALARLQGAALKHAPSQSLTILILLNLTPIFSSSPPARPAHVPQAATGGGGGIIGGGNTGGGGGGGGGGGWSDGSANSGDDGTPPSSSSLANPLTALLARWPGWQARTAADPSFAYKVALEQVIGVGAAVAGDMASRPGWGLKELDFVFATLVVGSILNFALMYLLAPTAAAGAGAGAAAVASSATARTGLGAAVAALFSPATLTRLGAPAGHAFEAGYSLPARLVNLAVKGGLFAAVGFGAGVVGTSLSNALLWARQRADPDFSLQNAPPGVLANAGAWAAHMGVSSNVRYQAINGADALLQPLLPPWAFRAWSVAVRTGNNVLGGMSFVVLAKLLGVQKSADGAGVADGGKQGKAGAVAKPKAAAKKGAEAAGGGGGAGWWRRKAAAA